MASRPSVSYHRGDSVVHHSDRDALLVAVLLYLDRCALGPMAERCAHDAVGFCVDHLGRPGSGLAIVVGTYCLVMGAYLGLAPSVYFFAQQQREKVNWLEAAVVAAVFVLLLASFGAAAHAASLYKTRIEGEARQFADVAFRRIFTEHDTYFLLGHLTKHAEEQAGVRHPFPAGRDDARWRCA